MYMQGRSLICLADFWYRMKQYLLRWFVPCGSTELLMICLLLVHISPSSLYIGKLAMGACQWCHDMASVTWWVFLLQINGRFVQVDDEPSFSSRKLEMLGWKIKPLEETLRDSVESYKAASVLDWANNVDVFSFISVRCRWQVSTMSTVWLLFIL